MSNTSEHTSQCAPTLVSDDMPKKRTAGQAGVDSQDCASHLTKCSASASTPSISDNQQSSDSDDNQCDSNQHSGDEQHDSDSTGNQHNNHTIQMVHICYEHPHDSLLKVRHGLHDIVLDDQDDIVWFRCCECKSWFQHDVCADDFFWYDYRDTCQVVQCCQCGVFLTDILLKENEETIMRFDDIKQYAFLDAKLEARFRRKLSIPDDIPIDLFNIPIVQVDAYCNVNSPSKICKANTVECPATYNAAMLEGLDDVSYVRRQHDNKFVYLGCD